MIITPLYQSSAAFVGSYSLSRLILLLTTISITIVVRASRSLDIMSAARTHTHDKASKPSFEPVIQLQQAPVGTGTEDFDPSRHLAYKPPSKVYTMKELGFSEEAGVSPIAVSEPFPLFTPEAVFRMRAEVLSKEVMANCQYSSNLAR